MAFFVMVFQIGMFLGLVGICFWVMLRAILAFLLELWQRFNDKRKN